MAMISTRRAGRPIDENKRAAVLLAAQQLFMRCGFSGTSMDAVARRAGVSKLTAYNHFGSKQQLFAQAVAAKCESAFVGIDPASFASDDPRAALIGFGRAFAALVLNPDAMAVHRLISAERARTPLVGRLFYENAVRPTRDKLATIIARQEAAGRLATGQDATAAAQDLLSLWRGRPFMMIELLGEALDDASLAAHIAHCVDLCLKAWTAPRQCGQTASRDPAL